MNEKKIINYVVAIFALTIFALAVVPKLYAEHYSIGSWFQRNNSWRFQ